MVNMGRSQNFAITGNAKTAAGNRHLVLSRTEPDCNDGAPNSFNFFREALVHNYFTKCFVYPAATNFS